MKKIIITATSTLLLIILGFLAIKNNKLDNSLNKTLTNTLPKTNFKAKEDNLSLSLMQLENNETNMIYSPLSIKYALSMLKEGANGKTKEELSNVLGNLGLNGYENQEDILSVANSIFIRDTYKKNVNQEYVDKLNSIYGAEVFIDSFSNAHRMNNWISEKTFDMLNNVIDDSEISGNTSLVLINAVAMDMKWEYKFKKEDEMEEYFYSKDGTENTVNTLVHTYYEGDVKFSDEEDLISITLPYKKYNDTQLEFVAIMPKEKSLHDFIEETTLENIEDIINNQSSMNEAGQSGHSLELHIPSFEYDYNLNLKNDLQALGVNEVFYEHADLSGISKFNDLFVSDIKHKAKIELTSEGTKAAAVTYSTLTCSCVPLQEDCILHFNKPFMFLIRDTKTKDIFFMGTLYQP